MRFFTGGAFLFTLLLLPASAAQTRAQLDSGDTLPLPVVHGNPFALLLNSRYSVHSGFEDSLPTQVLANVLWAMSRVPYSGDYREFYVATRNNLYRYDPDRRRLSIHLAGDHRYHSGSAFEVGVATPRHEDAGMAIQAGLLAAVAFWTDTGTVVCCPMKWATDYANNNWHPEHPILMVNVFGNAPARGLDSTVVAISSDSSLPLPVVNGVDTFEVLLEHLRPDSSFTGARVSLETVSQLLWAAYGVTPHLTIKGCQALTVPSAIAGYFLTGRIYLVTEQGVDRYWNRLPPGNNLTTRDHRLERLLSGDFRLALRSASHRIPANAPLYIVICVDDTTSYRTMQEAGFAVFNLLLQAQALNLAAWVTMPLTTAERSAIQTALLLPANQYPVAVFASGEAATGIRERPGTDQVIKIIRAQPAVRRGALRIEYLLRQPGAVRIEVFDLAGRPVKTLLDERQSAGYYSVSWDGTDRNGQPVRRGTYLVTISTGDAVVRHKVSWSR
ncbi:MAG: FlgD immunoglobulin-like domain containing protein [candidate division WOR-3 bacterium]